MGCSKIPQRIEIKVEGISGYIIEDVWIDKKDRYEEWEPHVQAIKHDNGDLSLRFCYWKRNPDGSRGDFMRVPMFIYEWTIKDLAQEARKHDAEIILMLLRKFKY